MVEEYEFLKKSDLQKLYSLVKGFGALSVQLTPTISILGCPYYAKKQISKDSSKTLAHNKLMAQNFSELLGQTKVFFENYLKDQVHLLPNVSSPGFHLIQIPPNGKTVINFHRDYDFDFLKDDCPELDVDVSKTQITFTVQLSQNENLESGLLYFEDSKFDKKLFRGERDHNLHDFMSSFANFKSYQPGMMNIHRNLTHSLFAENKSDSPAERVTFQGSLVKYKHGWLLFW